MPESPSSLYHPASLFSGCPRIAFLLKWEVQSMEETGRANLGIQRTYEDQIREGRFRLGDGKREVREGQGQPPKNWGVLLRFVGKAG